ncbi:MAG: UDP-N-acetylenolpyruvoylglucosamine reductase [Fusobacteriia bacterium 4572_132]|nr:MAG: UDP-N-acetylenolpyruvoylglucosamine reductase [Fusobacteriia bacterium 4572_132]
MKSLKNVSLKNYSNMKVGGEIKEIIFVENIDEIIKYTKKMNKINVLGNGTNILFKDGKIDEVLISLKKMNKIKKKDGMLEIEAGCTMSDLIKYMRKNNYSGIERLAGIPGTIGGLTVMNGGAYGVEIFDYIKKVEVVSENGEIKILNKNEINYGYRYTEFQKRKDIVTRIYMRLEKGFDSKKVLEISEQRKLKQPLEYPNLGSIFKNPKNDYAARLIEKVNLKGYEIGDAKISKKHTNFIINKGNAKYSDIIDLMNLVKKKIKEEYNVELENEIIIFPMED